MILEIFNFIQETKTVTDILFLLRYYLTCVDLDRFVF